MRGASCEGCAGGSVCACGGEASYEGRVWCKGEGFSRDGSMTVWSTLIAPPDYPPTPDAHTLAKSYTTVELVSEQYTNILPSAACSLLETSTLTMVPLALTATWSTLRWENSEGMTRPVGRVCGWGVGGGGAGSEWG